MPGSLAAAAPVTVLPASLCAAFSESRELPVLETEYRDGSVQTKSQATTGLRRWRPGKRLAAAALWTLREFWEARRGGLEPFYFYDPYDAGAGAIGSNYDATGVSTQGRHTCVFSGGWNQSIGVARTEASIELVEVA